MFGGMETGERSSPAVDWSERGPPVVGENLLAGRLQEPLPEPVDAQLAEAEDALRGLKAESERRQVETMLSGEADHLDAFLEVHAGAGGTESQDWALMLMRMYTRWAEKSGYKAEMLEMHDGEEAGIKSATLQITGPSAYGWLKTESGVHRLVRISPFDSQARRHTSFASVWVYPVVDDTIEIDIDEGDVRTDTYRASGSGGQHINTTDSAVRLTHVPTGIVVSCQNERSQHKNRASAMKVLKSRLYDMKLKEQQAKMDQLGGEKKDIAFGSQIRSYVLHPYQMVKDHRTKFQVGDIARILDGDLDEFIKAYLMKKALGKLEAGVPDDE